ncbi:MAG: phosphatidate cytidylyltransferase [Isosphaeraceae bacterium]|nr:phosphatidate cytidylyltransferase [Isosphaeraceae bacterium]
MLGTRLVIGLSMVAGLLAILCLDELTAPWFPFWFLLAIYALGSASLELVNLLKETSARPSGNTVFGGVMAIVCANWAPHLIGPMIEDQRLLERLPYDPLLPVSALAWPLLTFVVVVMASFVVQSAQFQKPGATMATIAGTVLAVAYVGLLGSFIIQLRWFDGPYHGILPLAFLVATSKGADTGAYTVGRLAGRHKLWPRLSPNKTVEGALGGLAAGIGAALIAAAVARFLLHVPTLGWAAAAGFGAVVGSTAQLGDLMESMIKRDCARKDASDAVPGFGGVLDVLDSLLFAGPVAFAYWLWLGP